MFQKTKIKLLLIQLNISKSFRPRKSEISKISLSLNFLNNLNAVKNKKAVIADTYNMCNKLAVPNCSAEKVGSVKTSGMIPIQQKAAIHSQVPNIPSKIISFPPLSFGSTFEKYVESVLIFLVLKIQGVLLVSR